MILYLYEIKSDMDYFISLLVSDQNSQPIIFHDASYPIYRAIRSMSGRLNAVLRRYPIFVTSYIRVVNYCLS